MMQRAALICAAIAFGIFASPVFAQQAPAEQPPTAQPNSQPPAAQPVQDNEPVPPFPHYPKAKPSHRWVDLGNAYGGRSRHHSSAAQHRSSRTKHATHKTKAHRGAARQATPRVSAKTMRLCHRMTYKEIIRHSSCRALMKQDLATAAPRHHAAAKHRSRHSARLTTAHRSTKHHRK
jgi:hypothetical protein